jgi:hypothetical protein
MSETRDVVMPVGDWLLVDGTVDNSVAIASVDGDEGCVLTGTRVRRAGWAASASHPRAGDGPVGWPPLDAEITISLTAEDWSFVVAELARWAAVGERDETARVERVLRAHLTDL